MTMLLGCADADEADDPRRSKDGADLAKLQ